MMPNPSNQPCILFVTPEAVFTPQWTESRPEFVSAHPEGFGDFPVKLIRALLDLTADVHVAQPDYRKIFAMSSRNAQTNSGIKLPIDRAHLAEDRAFFYSFQNESLARQSGFQRRFFRPCPVTNSTCISTKRTLHPSP